MKVLFYLGSRRTTVDITPEALLKNALRSALDKLDPAAALDDYFCYCQSHRLNTDICINNQKVTGTIIPLEIDGEAVFLVHKTRIKLICPPVNPYIKNQGMHFS